MAYFSLIYDGLISLIAGELSTYKRLPNAYDILENDILRAVKGYALSIGGGENTHRYIDGTMLTHKRDFTFTLTNLVTANELDATGRAVVEKAIFEDAYKVWKKLVSTTHLGNIQVSTVEYTSDTGIEFYYTDSNKVISLVSTLTLEYFE
jgi:hypothetical protein